MKVGGRDFNESKQSVEQKMRDQEPEMIQKYVVEVNGTLFPPKQVLAHVTGWPRLSFTTMEAQRVLTKIGLVCREAGTLPDGRAGWVATTGKESTEAKTDEERLAALEAAVATAQEAIAGLAARVRNLEGAA
jgi:hypothetical protein